MIFFNGLNYLHNCFLDKVSTTENEIKTRMTKFINRYNKKCHSFKPHIVSLKSRQILSLVNHLSNVEDKMSFIEKFNTIMVNISKQLYLKYDPHMIYTFHDEIHLVFYYNENGDYIYSGNVNKIITALVSSASIEMAKELSKQGIDLDFVYSGQFIEFDDDYEVLNYLIWRQLDCKRNTVTLLYKCVNLENFLNNKECNLKLDVMEKNVAWFVKSDLNKYYTGNIIKKTLYYKTRDVPKIIFNKNENENENESVVTRKKFEIENLYFADNFKENLNKYVRNKMI